jgi:DNA-binding CsgD family transcriptional regulator
MLSGQRPDIPPLHRERAGRSPGRERVPRGQFDARVVLDLAVTIGGVERLLEREDQLAVLVAAVDGMQDGRGAFVLVRGEAGIGKTSLVRALRARVGGRAAFLVGACEPLSVPVPLGPLRELADGVGAGDLVERRGGDRYALARSLLEELRTQAPVVAVVEDAHWADPGTLDVLRLLAHWVEDAPVVLVVTLRDDELGANAALAALVGDLATNPVVRRILLLRLSEAAVRTLSEPTGLDAREIVEITNGNPFLVVEALAGGGGIPASVRDATLARVGRLGPAARGLVEAAAVIGQRVRPQLLAEVAPNSDAAIEQALASGVMVDDGDRLGFRHELTRQAIEGSISAPRRAQLHARILSALATSLDTNAADLVRLAHHAEQAGLQRDAGRYAERAATEAERVGSLREASLQLERALRNGGGISAAERFELLLRYVRATNFAGGLEEARAAAEEAVSSAERELGPAAHGRALTVLSGALWSLDRVAEAKQAAEAAVALLEATDEVGELARAHSADLRMESIAFDASAVVARAPSALALAALAGLEDVRIDLTISLAVAGGHRGDPAARELLAEALRAAQVAQLPFQTIRAYVNGVDLAAESRDHSTVDALAGLAIGRLDTFQTAIPRENIRISLARSLLDRGRYDEAKEQAALGRLSSHGGVPLALTVEGLVRARRGEPGAQDLLEQAWESVATVPEGWRHGHIRAALAEAAWLRDDLEAALAQAQAGLAARHAGQLARSSGELALWASRCGALAEPPPNAAVPVLRELSGDWRGATQAWRKLEAPYEQALAGLPGDDRTARAAMTALQRLGAVAAARAFARERARQGAHAPRGPRRTTLANQAGLTRREQEVLAHVALGATNAGIARALHLSERTVAHHVSSILSKVGAPRRTAAVEAARRAGLLAQDGPTTDPT